MIVGTCTFYNPFFLFMNTTVPSFAELALSHGLKANLQKRNLITPTPIQAQCIPAALEGKDIIGIAQTGTGKTLAFGLPMIENIGQKKLRQALIVVPTRELALQIENVLKEVSFNLSVRVAVLIGGAPFGFQRKQLSGHPHIIVATPGRLLDHLEQRTLSLQQVNMLVLDEADRMFDMGFAPQIEKVLRALPTERQTMVFSATMPPEIAHIMKRHMKLPIRIEIAPQGTLASQTTQELFIIKNFAKSQLLEKLLAEYQETVLIFTRTKHGAKRVASFIKDLGHSAAELHSNRSQSQRKQAMDGFRSGRYRILVATDIAARGIDVSNIELVVNYDLPENPEDYVHRIGRTGRAGLKGKAISFAMPNQIQLVRRIERLTRKPLPTATVKEELPELRLSDKKSSYERDDSGSGSRGGRNFGGKRPFSRGGSSHRSSGYSSERTSEHRPYHEKSSFKSHEDKYMPESAMTEKEKTMFANEGEQPRKQWSDHPTGRTKRPFGSRPEGNKRPWSSQGPKRPYGERKEGSSERPWADRGPAKRPFGDRKPSGERSWSSRGPAKRSFSDRKEGGERSWGNASARPQKKFRDRNSRFSSRSHSGGR
ncbi:MAG: hypothetical protein A2V81_05235 [Candidatus Abawacabacteria bacterium RBG_16_42_10]|uniref:DEAD/DEAH box helicase n=1 Tax=Candidatus Abawacabacteria bacterium RBG_16_42_10 TaxID=1817814 RepID=A0A1F4XIR6_9BACT|nr:MAG: hypothetical protein A2V81_05235 [Candidatus Abawacabacteria bacterium RBG_16_42_10]